MINIHSLSIGYTAKGNDRTVASGLNGHLDRGQLTCLVGSNGVGKSTLLRTLSRFLPSLGGSITVQGRPLDHYTDKELAREISLVLTQKVDVQNLTVRELIGMGRSPYTGFWGRLSAEDNDAVDEAISLTGTEALTDRMIQTLSDGERQKVMIAKALAQNTPIILLDEPTAFLDFPNKVEVMQLLHRVCHTTGKTIFLSTHDLEFALQMADQLWLMSKGHGIVAGTPEDLALDGHLSSFFDHDGISFDMASGLYKVAFRCGRTVGISGEPLPVAMLTKAMRRCGIEAVVDAQTDVSINAGSDGFTIYRGGEQEHTARTVAEVIGLMADE